MPAYLKGAVTACLITTLTLTLTHTANAQEAGNADSGRKLFETCLGCHGVAGYNNTYPTYKVPKLGGQSSAYITAALRAYRDGEREHPTMQANAWNLSDQDMADIGAYLEAKGLD